MRGKERGEKIGNEEERKEIKREGTGNLMKLRRIVKLRIKSGRACSWVFPGWAMKSP